LGQFLASAIPRDQSFDAVVPVPPTGGGDGSAASNQSALLAQAVARRYGLTVVAALRRQRATAAQAGLTNARRRENVAAAFAVRRNKVVAGRRILLIDDVMTTGATASSCALALKQAGARYVALLTLARVDRRFSAVPFPAPWRWELHDDRREWAAQTGPGAQLQLRADQHLRRPARLGADSERRRLARGFSPTLLRSPGNP